MVGIVNVTPDSFSDGGLYLDPDAAVAHAQRLIDEGADILDIGGESTRPGASPVTTDEELRRVLPVIRKLARSCTVPLSVDTRKAEVARQALDAGAVMVNDVTAMTGDPDMAGVISERRAFVCLMHMQGTPQTMQLQPHYDDVVLEVREYLAGRAGYAKGAGIHPSRIILDPGIGFGKTLEHNLDLLRNLGCIADLGYPVMVGTSRKSMIGMLLGGAPPEDRLEGTAATVAASILYGASLVRVHDVAQMARVARVAHAIARRPPHQPLPQA